MPVLLSMETSRNYAVNIPKDGYIRLDNKNTPPTNSSIYHASFPEKIILRLGGTVGSGKGTIGSLLAKQYNIPHIDSGRIWRTMTYALIQQGIHPKEINESHAQHIWDDIELEIHQHAMRIHYKGVEMTHEQLRSREVNVLVPECSRLFRSQYNSLLSSFITSHNASMVLDGRGSNTPYLQDARTNGWRIINILLYTTIECAAWRRLLEHISSREHTGDNCPECTDIEAQRLKYEQIKSDIVTRDRADYRTIMEQHLGWILPDSGVLETTDYTIDEVFTICRTFIEQSLFKLVT